MESYLKENFGGVQPNNSSEEALGRRRKLVGVVENPKRRFRFTADLDKRSEATSMKKNNHEKLREAVLVSKAALQFIHGIVPSSSESVELSSIVEGHDVKKLKSHGPRWRPAQAVRGCVGLLLSSAGQAGKVVYGNVDRTADQLKQHTKLLSSYSLNALWFAIPMFYASLSHHSSTSKGFSVGDALFLVAIITDAALILLLPTLGNALVCISWLLLELATCVLILSFNKDYAFAILAALLLAAVVALLQPKLQHTLDMHVLPSLTHDMIGDDEESQHLGHLLELSQGIASFGGLSTAIAERFMVGPVNAVGFIFFCAITLGLYLSMVVTVGAVSHAHAKCLAILIMVLVVLMFITASISFSGHSGS